MTGEPEKQTVEVQAEVIVLKVGRLEIEAHGEPGRAIPFAAGHTKIRLDGKPLPCTAVKVEGGMDSPWKVTLEMWAKDAPAAGG